MFPVVQQNIEGHYYSSSRYMALERLNYLHYCVIWFQCQHADVQHLLFIFNDEWYCCNRPHLMICACVHVALHLSNVTPQSRLDLKLWSCHTLRKELLGSASIDLLDTLRTYDGKSKAHAVKNNVEN